MKVLVADPLHQEGLDLLEAESDVNVEIRLKMKPEEFVEVVTDFDAVIVRSESQVTAEVIEAGTKLRVVGRAGVGVDNIDLDAATRKGIAVVNAPTGNTIAAAEHTIAIMMSLSRHIAQANASMRQGQWNRADFMGIEMKGKTLGIVGLGRVGSEVAKRALGLEMRVLGYDPYLVPERAARLGVQIAEFDSMLATCDFLTLHTPLTDTTKSLIGTKEISLMKPTARIINVARGGLVDEDALIQALNDEKLAGAAIDVYTKEPLEDYRLALHPKIVATPHLGASTLEAQAAVTREVVEQVLTVLKGQPARFTVNVPFVAPEVQDVIEPFLEAAVMIGKIAIQLANGQPNSVTVQYQGELATSETGTLKAAVLMGLLQPVTEDRVNLVNAALLAEERGLQIKEEKDPVPQQFANEITVRLATTGGEAIVGGTHLRGRTHVTRVGEHLVDAAVDSPYLLIIENLDRPGMIGTVGEVAGRHDINISFMEVGRAEARGKATMMVGLDDPMPDSVLGELRQNPSITSVRLIQM
ncbi:MAG: phosphoglycerate dehydrogenase [Chloroflexota bacterium]|nr:phosphoglycerate dehydrogenase [Chloroflexota bacterium]